jgi:hypothetical protein
MGHISVYGCLVRGAGDARSEFIQNIEMSPASESPGQGITNGASTYRAYRAYRAMDMSENVTRTCLGSSG